MKINPTLSTIGLILNGFLTLYMYTSKEYNVIAPIALASIVVSIIGLTLMLLNKIKIGGIIFIIGCVLFVPLGLVGIFGARKIMNTQKEEQFIKEEYGSN